MINHSLAPNRPAGLEGTRQFLAEWLRGGSPPDESVELVPADGDLVRGLLGQPRTEPP